MAIENINTNETNTSEINVVFQELTTASNDLSNISAEMKSLTEKMNGIIEEIRNVWKDDNGRKFADRFEKEVNSQFQKYYGTVQEYSDFIKGAHDKYVQQTETIQAAVEGTGTEG